MESLAEDLATMIRRPLTEDHVAAIRRIGAERSLAEGEIILRIGDPADRFFYVLDGTFQLWDETRGEAVNQSRLGPGQFIGEIAFLNGGGMLYTLRAAEAARVIEPRARRCSG